MANKDYERMVKLGEWLERCLNPNIKPWDVNDLFNDGMKIIGIYHEKIQPSKIIENIKLKPDETIYSHIESFPLKMQKYQNLLNSISELQMLRANRETPSKTLWDKKKRHFMALRKIETELFSGLHINKDAYLIIYQTNRQRKSCLN